MLYSINIPTRLYNKLNEDLKYLANVITLIENTKNYFLLSPEFFPEYTIHGHLHIDVVLKNVNKLITNKSLENMTSRDIAFLISAIIVHDIGMFIGKSGLETLIFGDMKNNKTKYLDDYDWEELWNDFIINIKHTNKKQLVKIFGDGKPINEPNKDFNKITHKDLLVYGEFIRRNHHRLAHEICNIAFMGSTNLDIFSKTSFSIQDKDLIGLIARSHGMAIRDTEKYLKSNYSLNSKKPLGIPIFYLMILLRLADYLDAGQHRAPREIFDRENPLSEISYNEWCWNEAIDYDSYSWNNENDNLEIFASPDTSPIFVKIKDWINGVQKELDLSWSIICENYGMENYGLSIHRIKSNILEEKIVKNLNKKFLTKPARLTVNPDVLKLLIQPLYGNNPSIGVRELLQNAIDACNERGHIESNTYEGVITVKIDSHNNSLEISDNGIGMNDDTIINYYLTAGSSYRSSDNWSKDFTDSNGSKIIRSGRFGIGILSTFLIGDEISVTTRYIYDDIGYKFSMKIDQDDLNVVRTNCSIGTTIKVKIKNGLMSYFTSSNNHYNLAMDWKRWYMFKTPKVYYYFDGKELFEESKRIFIPSNDYECHDWNVVKSNIYECFRWKYERDTRFYCNGISIPNISTTSFGIGYGKEVRFPSVSLIDKNANLDLNLSRLDVLKIPEEGLLLEEIYKSYIGKLLSVKWSTLNDINNNILNDFALYYDFAKGHYELKKNSHINNETFIVSKTGYSIVSNEFISKLNLDVFGILVLDNNKKDINCLDYINEIPMCIIFSDNSLLGSHIDVFWNLFKINRHMTINSISINMDMYERLEKINRTKGTEFNINNILEKKKRVGDFIYMNNDKTTPHYDLNKLDSNIICLSEYRVKDDVLRKDNNLIEKLITKYLGEDIWIPFDFNERKRKFPKAFEELHMYIDAEDD